MPESLLDCRPGLARRAAGRGAALQPERAGHRLRSPGSQGACAWALETRRLAPLEPSRSAKDSAVVSVPGASACPSRPPLYDPPRAWRRSSGGDTGAKRWCSRCAHSRASRLHARRPSTKRPPASADARSRASSASYALPARLYACRDARRGRGRPRHCGPRLGACRLTRPAGASPRARLLARG
jgi:hypothetical protein